MSESENTSTGADGALQPLASIDTTSSTFTLPDGRRIGYSVHGPSNGSPLFLLHGIPGSRLDAMHFAADAERVNCRLIGVDRPGIGLSSPESGPRSLSDHASDISALADHLQLSTFRVLGASAGGPYALACAATLPSSRLLATGVAIGLPPLDAGWRNLGLAQFLTWKLVAGFPWLTRQFVSYKVPHDKAAIERSLDADLAAKTPEDRKTLQDPIKRAMAVATLREATHQGLEGFVQDAAVLGSPWGFNLTNISARVRFWYAENDSLAPPDLGRWMNNQLSNSEFTLYKGTTHGTLMSRHSGQIFEQLMAEG